MRFDFTHPNPLTEKEIKAVEKLVNQKIKESLPIRVETMSFEESQKRSAMAVFSERYPQKVKVYSIGDFSCEVCGGPHVSSTAELGKFKIIKQEGCGSGKRRIYAKLDME
jgi:alanyl-tRNA synthetase